MEEVEEGKDGKAGVRKGKRGSSLHRADHGGFDVKGRRRHPGLGARD